jgi:hypothetical protein
MVLCQVSIQGTEENHEIMINIPHPPTTLYLRIKPVSSQIQVFHVTFFLLQSVCYEAVNNCVESLVFLETNFVGIGK